MIIIIIIIMIIIIMIIIIIIIIIIIMIIIIIIMIRIIEIISIIIIIIIRVNVGTLIYQYGFHHYLNRSWRILHRSLDHYTCLSDQNTILNLVCQ